MTPFKTPINRPDNGKRNWHERCGNTAVSDGYVSNEANFGNRASAKTIIKSYLHSYQLQADDDGSYGGSFEIRIDRRPGSDSVERFDVTVSNDGKWAVVQ